jgi:hypothetical protein
MFILRLTEALDAHNVPYAVVGGYALALHGAVRGTVDIDIVIHWQKQHLINAKKALNSLGLVSRVPLQAHEVFDFRDEYVERRQMQAWSFSNPARPDEQVNLMINFDLSGKGILAATANNGHKIRYLNRKDLIAMKQTAGSPQDMADIEALEKIA